MGEQLTAELNEANATKVLAESASTTSSLVMLQIESLFNNDGRKKREAATTASHDTPTTCAAFITLAGLMTTAIIDAKYSYATSLGETLLAADEDTISCTASEQTSLSAKYDNLADAKNELFDVISTLETTITSLIAAIETLQEQTSTIAGTSGSETAFQTSALSSLEQSSTIASTFSEHSTAQSSGYPTFPTLPLYNEGCCVRKVVGRSTYSLRETHGGDWELEGTGCKNSCIYQKEDSEADLENRYCF